MKSQDNYFVTAATIAAELDKARIVAKEVSLASNNAGVLAVRAGAQAAGFGALAEFLDQLAKKIIHASADINQQAISMSKITTQAVRTNSAKYDWVERVSKLDIEKLCPQHGRIFTGNNVKRF